MSWQAMIAGASLGLISSFHCVGMCGPLALSLPVQHLTKSLQLIAIILYNAGRVGTYTLLGLVLGLAGHQLFLSGWQQLFSILLGGGMLLFSVQHVVLKKLWQPKWMLRFHFTIQSLMGKWLASKYLTGYFVLGLANGLLPCGMVYLAIAGALSTSQVMESTSFMLAFGVATLPAMLAMGILSIRINLTARRAIRRMMPIIVTAVAILLIVRGLQLGIPFLSPVMAASPVQAVHCH